LAQVLGLRACAPFVTLPASADESAAIELVPESQHLPGHELVERKKYKITFGPIYLSKPMMTESDGDTTTLFPHEARLRNLTCVPVTLSHRTAAKHCVLRCQP
jgi:hypothetical protein